MENNFITRSMQGQTIAEAAAQQEKEKEKGISLTNLLTNINV